MTQVITRYFESAKQARATRHELLHRRRFSGWIVHLFEVADGLADKLAAKNVEAKTAKAYAKYLKLGGAVLLVQAGSKPLGGAKITRDAMTAMGATALDGLMEEVRVQDLPKTMLGVLNDHPHMLTRERDPYNTNFYMANWPIPLISRHKPMSLSMFPKHARMASFPISLISRRKPFTGTAIGRHTRMANGPFLHLTNGKQGTNSLVPGGARMANFPISLISDRQPTNRSIFPKHARMANFPLPLISRR